MSGSQFIKLVAGSVFFVGAITALFTIRRSEEATPAINIQQSEKKNANVQTLEPFIPSPSVALSETNTSGFSADQLQDYLDDHDLSSALEAARSLIHAERYETREEAVLAMDWIGVDALHDLARATHHSDTHIALIAFDALQSNLDDLDDPNLKVELLWIALNALDPSIQNQAIQEVGFLPPEYGLPLLIETLKNATPEQHDALQKNLYFLSDGLDYETYSEWKNWLSNFPKK
jgi:hypothetical protein